MKERDNLAGTEGAGEEGVGTSTGIGREGGREGEKESGTRIGEEGREGRGPSN